MSVFSFPVVKHRMTEKAFSIPVSAGVKLYVFRPTRDDLPILMIADTQEEVARKMISLAINAAEDYITNKEWKIPIDDDPVVFHRVSFLSKAASGWPDEYEMEVYNIGEVAYCEGM